jgi:hypothetical protein
VGEYRTLIPTTSPNRATIHAERRLSEAHLGEPLFKKAFCVVDMSRTRGSVRIAHASPTRDKPDVSDLGTLLTELAGDLVSEHGVLSP